MLKSVLMALAGANLRRKVGEMKRAMVFYIVAGIALALGAVFLLLAAFIFFAERHGALYAALGFGAAFFLVAILTMAIHGLGGGVSTRRREEERRADELKAIATAAAIGAAPAIIRSTGVVGALLLPLAAAAAYAIYRENAGPREPRDDEA